MLRDLIHPASGETFREIRNFRSSKPSENGPKTAESEQSANAIPAKPATAPMPSRPELDRICRAAVADFPDVDPDRLRAFLEVADDPEWATEPAARQLARRMSEGLITWTPEDE